MWWDTYINAPFGFVPPRPAGHPHVSSFVSYQRRIEFTLEDFSYGRFLLLFVGCSLYRRAATGADAGAAPTTAGSPVLDTPQGAALSGSAPTAAGTSAPGDLRTPPPSSTTPSMSAPARGRAPAAESPLSAGESGSRAIVFDPPLAGGYGQGDGSPGSSAAGAPPKPGGPGDSAKPIGG